MTYQELVATRARVVIERDALVSQADTLLAADTYGEAEEARVTALKGQITRQNERLGLLDGQLAAALNAPVVQQDLAQPAIIPAHDPAHPAATTPAHGQHGRYANMGEQAMEAYAAAKGDGMARERLIENAQHGLAEMGIEAAALGQNTIVDSEGGFLVQTDQSQTLWQRTVQGGAILSRLSPLPLSGAANSIELPGVDETSRANGSRWGGIRAYWVEEAEAPTATLQKYFKVALRLKKAAALTYATDEMLQHVGLMDTLLTQGMSNELRFVLEDACYEGDGSGKPFGVLTAPATVSVAKETGQAATTIVHDNLKKMWARAYGPTRANAVWMINQDCEPTLDDLAKVIGTSGVEPNYVTYGPDGVLRIKGRPVVTIEYAPTVGTVGDIMLVDWSQYAYITGAVQQATSMHFKFDTFEQAFRASVRVDGALRWKSALTPFKGTSNTQSPVITLATRA